MSDAASETLSRLGWSGEWANALAAVDGSAQLRPARVTAVHRGHVHVVGEQLDELLAVRAGLPFAPVVGDWVALDGEAVRVVLPRRNELRRADGVLVSNADLVLILTSLNRDLNLRRIERFVALVRADGIEPLVVLTKADLSTDPAAAVDRISTELRADAVALSVQRGWGIEAVRDRLRARHTNVLLGMSGVGKSTLVNHLLGDERQRTLPVRARDDRGRHATVHRELFVLPNGALLVDTPGVRRPELADADGVDETFDEIVELARGCRFSDCTHTSEPGCAVRDVVSEQRLNSMRKLSREGSDASTRSARQRGG
jgi:ribosome biogenesis GTPase / thiamine phosphate phosphatase